jgi:glycerophosphoryl diester phosphodiesterase
MIAACKSSKTGSANGSATMQLPAFNKEGHRGTRGLMPENTIQAMRKAVDLDVNTVEVDVVFSKDMKVVISHDFYFHQDITTTPEGKTLTAKEAQSLLLYNMTYDSIKKYDVGMKPYAEYPKQQKIPAYKPLLGELVDSTDWYAKQKGRPVMYNIELKIYAANDGTRHPPVEEFVDRVMEVVKDRKLEQRSYLQSFDVRPLQVLHKKYPSIVTALLTSDKVKTFEEQLNLLGYQPQMWSPHFSLVTPELVSKCHNKGIKLIPWTVNTLEDMKRLKAMGVDGIITDYPDLFAQL